MKLAPRVFNYLAARDRHIITSVGTPAARTVNRDRFTVRCIFAILAFYPPYEISPYKSHFPLQRRRHSFR